VSEALAWVGVALLGAAGALLRFRVDGAVSSLRPTAFPVGTLVVNLTGGFALGLLVGLAPGRETLLVLGSGLLGGYTTFSTWMLESQRLAEDGEIGLMWLNLLGPVVAGLTATGLGWLGGEALA
jgi:CrcB protein